MASSDSAGARGLWAAHLPPGVGPDNIDLAPAANLTARMVGHWRREPTQVFLADVDGRSLTGAELDDATARAAGRLAGLGLNAGDRVLCSCDATLELAIAHLAALRLGLTVVPTNTAYRAAELAHIVSDAKPVLAIVDDRERAGWLREASADLTVLGPDLAVPDSVVPSLDEATLASVGLLAYTSGTTGRPKGALLSHANLLASAEAVRLAWRWTAEDRLFLCLPLFHLHGLGVGLHGSLVAGASVLLSPRFEPDAVLDTAEAGRATMFFGVPTMYHRLAASPRADALARLRLVVSGSAPLPTTVQQAIERASGARVLERYGMTETLMLVSNPYVGERRAGTVGLPLPGVEVKLDPVNSEVLVKGPNVFAGYLGRPQADVESFTEDGFFHTGDAGVYDEAGYLILVARLKELIISGGYNVYPREVEDALREHPAVLDAAVIGVADPEWGEAVTAFCETDGSVSGEALVAFVGDRLARYKRPKRIILMDSLPRNAMGKVLKTELARE